MKLIVDMSALFFTTDQTLQDWPVKGESQALGYPQNLWITFPNFQWCAGRWRDRQLTF